MKCPKPSCNGQNLNRVTNTNQYICLSCTDTYTLTNGIPAKDNPIVKPKYKNNRVKVDGILFDSQKEANYYCELKLMLKSGTIKWYCRQPQFIILDGNDVITYKADFIVHSDVTRVIDVKGFQTAEFKLKKKLLEAQYNMKLELI